jgi:hypothetical protein
MCREAVAMSSLPAPSQCAVPPVVDGPQGRPVTPIDPGATVEEQPTLNVRKSPQRQRPSVSETRGLTLWARGDSVLKALTMDTEPMWTTRWTTRDCSPERSGPRSSDGTPCPTPLFGLLGQRLRDGHAPLRTCSTFSERGPECPQTR